MNLQDFKHIADTFYKRTYVPINIVTLENKLLFPSYSPILNKFFLIFFKRMHFLYISFILMSISQLLFSMRWIMLLIEY